MSRASVVKLAVLFVLPLALGLSSGDPSTLSFRFMRESAPYVEPITGWMVQNTVSKLFGTSGTSTAGAREVRSYFALVAQDLKLRQATAGGSGPARMASQEDSLTDLEAKLRVEGPQVERAIQQDIARAAEQDGLDRRIGGLDFLFPPVYFRFESLPNLLVVSPRNRVERVATVLLQPDLTTEQMTQIEKKTAGSEYSTLVTPIGGLGVYPSMVPEDADPRWILQTVAHEWTHQFLALRPLGWRYALGGEADSRMITVNETVAEMIGTELGNQVFQQLYPDSKPADAQPSPQQTRFRAEMHDIRTRVDALLAAGQVTEAESFMESSRERLAQEGFYIRKLNQAYFAFYGSYASDPSSAGTVGREISERVHQLRSSSASLGDFLWKISAAGSYQAFQRLAPLP